MPSTLQQVTESIQRIAGFVISNDELDNLDFQAAWREQQALERGTDETTNSCCDSSPPGNDR